MDSRINVQEMVKSFEKSEYVHDVFYPLLGDPDHRDPLDEAESLTNTMPPDVLAYANSVWPELAARAIAELAEEFWRQIHWSSPIEQIMFFALQREFPKGHWLDQRPPTLLCNQRLSHISQSVLGKGNDLYQRGDIDYEIDLFLILNNYRLQINEKPIWYPFYVAIECDGHDFHEKTKEQAQKDKTKDRTLKAKGLTVLRFTGTEITRKPHACAREVRTVIESEFELFKKRLGV